MKKSTILIIMVVFLMSIFVVGVFGMKSVPYNEITYVEKIVPTQVTLDNGTVVEIQQNEKGYYVYVPYKEKRVVMIDYEIVPNDATNRKLEVTIEKANKNSDAEILDNGGIQLNDKGIIIVRYFTTDSVSPKTMVFYIYPTTD